MRRRRNPEIIVGRVNSDGSIAAGDGFTSVKTATGNYTVTITAPGFRLVAATVTVVGALVASTSNFTGTSFQVLNFVGSTGAAADGAFSFVAVGVQ